MNCSALSAHFIFGKRAASKCQKKTKKHTGQSKDFAFLNVPANVRDEIIKLDDIEYKIKSLKLKKHVLNTYLNLIKLQLDQARSLIIILKTKMCLFKIFQAIKTMLKLRFH